MALFSWQYVADEIELNVLALEKRQVDDRKETRMFSPYVMRLLVISV